LDRAALLAAYAEVTAVFRAVWQWRDVMAQFGAKIASIGGDRDDADRSMMLSSNRSRLPVKPEGTSWRIKRRECLACP